jgi:hypothetical protein
VLLERTTDKQKSTVEVIAQSESEDIIRWLVANRQYWEEDKA